MIVSSTRLGNWDWTHCDYNSKDEDVSPMEVMEIMIISYPKCLDRNYKNNIKSSKKSFKKIKWTIEHKENFKPKFCKSVFWNILLKHFWCLFSDNGMIFQLILLASLSAEQGFECQIWRDVCDISECGLPL